MNVKAKEDYSSGQGPQMTQYWVRQGPKTAAFLLVIPGSTAIGYGLGLLAARPLPYGVIGLGAGLLIWGLVVSLTD
jgi:hypothetical protein